MHRPTERGRRLGHAPLLLGLLAVALFSGCADVRVTQPERTATEQFLLSVSVGHAVERLNTSPLRGRDVYVDKSYFAASEQAFVIGELRAHLLNSGVRLVQKKKDAEIILEVRSGGVGIDQYDFLLGIPSIPFGALGGLTKTGTTQIPFRTPELALLKSNRQWGFASVAFVAYWADTGEVVANSGPHVGRSRREDYWFFGLGPRSTGNIPTVESPEKTGGAY